MKNLTFLVLLAVFMICLAFQEKVKTYSVSLTLEQWSAYTNGIEYSKQQLRQSDLPSKQVALITDSLLTPLQTDIIKQVNAQLAAEKKVDSSKPKK